MANYYCCVPESAQCTEVPQYVCQMEEETRCTYPKDYKDEYCPPPVSIKFVKFEKNRKKSIKKSKPTRLAIKQIASVY